MIPESVRLLLHFLLGGLIVSLSTYAGASGRGFLAAFISTFPAITGITIVLIYVHGGAAPAQLYATHLLWLLPAWIAYVAILIIGIPRWGFWTSLVLALSIYMVGTIVLQSWLR